MDSLGNAKTVMCSIEKKMQIGFGHTISSIRKKMQIGFGNTGKIQIGFGNTGKIQIGFGNIGKKIFSNVLLSIYYNMLLRKERS
jgi:putative transposon-encoded protein